MLNTMIIMKKIGSLLLVSIFAGAITLGTYKMFFEDSNYKIVAQNQTAPTFNTNYTPTSAKGAGINEVDFTIAAENTVNAVVHVKNVTTGRTTSRGWDFFYGSQRGSQQTQVGTGSGVIISADGYIVTNNHVIAKADKLQVTLNNNKTYDAELIGSDSNSDIALLKIDTDNNLPYLAFGDSNTTKIGEWVLAVGNPFNLTSTVTAGIISAKARNLGKVDQSFIQTDAAVNPGNSGGALVNTNGDLIGINTAITSQTGSYVGYSFAVPSNIAKKVIDDLMEYGSVQKGLLGISTYPMNSPYVIENRINEIEGVYIADIVEDSGAYDAELQEGDVIKKLDNITIKKYADLTGYLNTKRPNDTVNVTIERSGKKMITPVILRKRNTIEVPIMGLTVKNLTEKDKKAYKTDKGVKIVAVPETYRNYGLNNKVIISVDDKDIKDVEDARTIFSNISKYGKTVITMLDKNGERERLIFQ